MDITLERILSLMPHKPDGSLKHGAKKEFADKIGVKHPQIVSDWIAGRNKSYKSYLYAISAKYGVSVEWLRGETDIKEKTAPTDGSGLNPDYFNLTPENQALVDSMIEKLLMSQSND